MNDWPSALEYGDDLPDQPRELRVWLFRAYHKRLEWAACHEREELVRRTNSELSISSWMFFPWGRAHPLIDRIRGEEVAALTAATWVLARDTGFPVEERILFARLCRWARRIAWANAEKANWRAKQEAKQRLASTLSGSKTAPVRVPTPEAAPVAVKKRPCALEYGDDLPEHPRTLRIWLFHAYRKRLEWLVCHHREELAFRLKKETVHCWIFFPPGGTHRLRWRIRGEEAAALKAATWMLKRDPRFLAEERVLFARLFGWAQRVARHDAQMGELNSEREAKNRLNWTPATRKQRGGFRPGTDQKT